MKRCESCGAPPSSRAVDGVCLVENPFEDEFCAYCGSRFETPRPKTVPMQQFNPFAYQQQQAMGMMGSQNYYGGALGGALGYALGMQNAFGNYLR